MKVVILLLAMVFVVGNSFAQGTVPADFSPPCQGIDIHKIDIAPAIFKSSDHQIASIWFVPRQEGKVHFLDAIDGEPTKKYVIAGDLLLAGVEQGENICASYINKNKVAAYGWLHKKDVKEFALVDFGAFDVDESQKNIKQANRALDELASDLPDMKNWQGKWKNWIDKPNDIYQSIVTIAKKKEILKLDTSGIFGSIGTGSEEELQNLTVKGAMARARNAEMDSGDNPVCDIVIIGFNNAILATSGSHCMGSGAGGSYPEISGVYWRK